MQAPPTLALLCLPLLGLSACNTQPAAVAGSRSPTYTTDLANKAATCLVTPVSVEDGKAVAATMTTSSNGWCGIPVRRADQPLGAALLTQPPRSGSVYVHTVGDETRVDYTHRPGTRVADSFAVKFIPGDATMTVTVAAAAPAGAAK